VLPYYVVTRKHKGTKRDRPDLMTGNAYRLTKIRREKKDEDKRFDNVTVSEGGAIQ
jgi:hypothetical protein